MPIIDPNVPTKAFTHETFVYLEAKNGEHLSSDFISASDVEP